MMKNKKAHKKHNNLLPAYVLIQSSYKQDVFKDPLTEINNSNLSSFNFIISTYAVAWLRHYATSRNVMGSI
jgi:hypothetical protein